MEELFQAESSQHIKQEREKARRLKQSRWWQEKIKTGKCHHCGGQFEPHELTMDHLVPLARGGRSGKNNVVVACKPCNFKKSHQTLVGFKLKNI